jgi:lipoate-protein ligase A
MGWRQINTDLADPYYVTAADEAISIQRSKNLVPNTLHFYRRNKPTISLGRSRKIHEDIDLLNSNKIKAMIIRRTTGGGTIYTDPGCLIYSLIFSKNNSPFQSTQDIFKNICNTIKETLFDYDINTEYKPPNDVLLNGKKISGAGLLHKGNITLIHGTLLYSTNLDQMNQILKKSPTSKPVTTLEVESKNPPKMEKIQQGLSYHFAQLFQTYMKLTELSIEEKALINQLIHTRYKRNDWTYMR